MEYGRIEEITEIYDFELANAPSFNSESGGQLGLSSMVNSTFGGRSMDGYLVKTNDHAIRVLIDNGQSCCENWGYFSSDDDLSTFVGSELNDIELTDTALKTESLPEDVRGYRDKEQIDVDEGGIQFVTFQTSSGSFQLAVYNAHNGYYGHGILVAVDDEIRCNATI